MEKMEFLGLCTAVHTVWKIGGFFGGALGRAALILLASASGARFFADEREHERRSKN